MANNPECILKVEHFTQNMFKQIIDSEHEFLLVYFLTVNLLSILSFAGSN